MNNPYPYESLLVGYDSDGNEVRTRITPHWMSPTDLTSPYGTGRVSGWLGAPRLDPGSAAAAGTDYSERWLRNPEWAATTREEALRMIRAAVAVARMRAKTRRQYPDQQVVEFVLDEAAEPPAAQRGGSTVIDPRNHIHNVTWPTPPPASPDGVVARIDQVVAEAESLVASVRAVQRRDRAWEYIRSMSGTLG